MSHIKGLHPICETFSKRAGSALALPPLPVHTTVDRLSPNLKKMRKHDVMKVVRSWSNSWATSHRFHERIRLPCLLGCTGELDSMSHYTKCPILFALIRVLRPDTSPCHATRCGLVNHSAEELRSLACTYTAYHTLRRDPDLHMHVFNSYIFSRSATEDLQTVLKRD